LYEDIRKLLEAHQLEKVDIVVHHGYFAHMLPEALLTKGLPHGCLEVDKIKKYVSGCVLNGHVHISSIYENVISIGSFDRMTHGEETPKGFYKITIDENKTYRFEFIENKEANKFITYDMRSFPDTQSAMDWFSTKWEHLSKTLIPDEPIRVRLVTDDLGLVEGCSAIAKRITPQVCVDHQGASKRAQMVDNVATNLEELPQISPANIQELLDPILKKKDPNVNLESMHKILESIKEEK